MAIVELYSQRNKPKYFEVYHYEDMSLKLRTQISTILRKVVSSHSYHYYPEVIEALDEEFLSWVFDTLAHEYGVSKFGNCRTGDVGWFNWHLQNEPIESVLDLLDLTLRIMDKYMRSYFEDYSGQVQDNNEKVNEAISEVNERMKMDGFGYEFTNGQLIRIDSQYVHAEVVKPALYILEDFDGAREEFLSAHEHYRHGAYEECIADCNKSFESLMKGICHERGWEYDPTAQAKKLIKTCLDNELIPTYLQEQFAQYLNLLSSGIPTIRNKEAGHGQGHEVKDPAQSLTSYALHLTASNLVFLGECNKALR